MFGLLLYYTAAGVSAVWHVSPCFTKVQIIFSFPLGSLGPMWVFENGVLLMYTLEGVSSFANFITAYEESQ